MWSQTPSVTGAATPTVTFSDIYTSLQPLSTVYQPRRRLHHILWSGKCRQWAELYSNNSRLSTINLNIMPSMYFPLLKSFVVSFSAALWRNQSRQHPFRKLLSEDTKDQPGRKFSLMPHHRDFYWVRTGPTRLLMSNNSRGWWSVTKDFFVFPKGLAAVPFTSSSSVEIHVQQQTSSLHEPPSAFQINSTKSSTSFFTSLLPLSKDTNRINPPESDDGTIHAGNNLRNLSPD